MRDPWYLINYGSNTNEFRNHDLGEMENHGKPRVIGEYFTNFYVRNP